jgi:hypothetical protein
MWGALRAVGGRVWAGADAALPARVPRDCLRTLRHLHLVRKGVWGVGAMKIIVVAFIIFRFVQIKMTILRCEYSFFPKLLGIFLGEVVQEMLKDQPGSSSNFFLFLGKNSFQKSRKKEEMSYFEELSGGLFFFWSFDALSFEIFF